MAAARRLRHHRRRITAGLGQRDAMRSATTTLLGWREYVGLPGLGIDSIKAKVDTGARSSCLHAREIVEYEDSGVAMVRFLLEPTGQVPRFCASPVVDRRPVRDSGGHVTLRPFIRSWLRLGEALYEAEINLAPRAGMLFPMLLGRTALAGRYCVDPEQSYLLGLPPGHDPDTDSPEPAA
jgi:hypothetical protein